MYIAGNHNCTDMNPEKALFDRFREDPEFEYVRFLAFKYFPDYADQPDMYDYELPPMDTLVDAFSEEEEPEQKEPAIIGCERGFTLFKRIQEGKATFFFTKEDFLENASLQGSINAIGLDPEKFWNAILFIHHMAEMENINCRPLKPSIHDNVKDLIAALRAEGTDVIIKARGKKPVTIDDLDTKGVVAYFLEYCDGFYAKQNSPTYTGRQVLINAEDDDQGVNWQMYDEYKAFTDIFNKYCKDDDLPTRVKGQTCTRDKDWIISRILFFTKVTPNKRFWKDRDAMRSVKHYCETHKRPLKSSGLLW